MTKVAVKDNAQSALINFILSAYPEEQRASTRLMVEAFYTWKARYPEYASKLTRNAPINTDLHPEYTYAARMSGMSAQFIRSCEWSFTNNLKKELDAVIEQGFFSQWYTIQRLSALLKGQIELESFDVALKEVRSEQAGLAQTEIGEFKRAYQTFLKTVRAHLSACIDNRSLA